MSVEVSWFSALCDDDYQYLGVHDESLKSSWTHCSSITQNADRHGYDGILLPSGYQLGIDTIAFAGGVAPLTEQIRLLVAVRCGELCVPQLARQLATLDQTEEFPTVPGSGTTSPRISPDGRWLAYVSNESGVPEVYVRPFPDASSGAVWQVSVDGGDEPMWAHSGRELFYKGGGQLVAAEVVGEPSFAVRARRPLFAVNDYFNNPFHARYEVLPTDQSFIMIEDVRVNELRTIVVRNWLAAMEAESGE